MITINDRTYRNLQEQVLKNQADIADFVNTTEILGKFGIRVVGTVPTADLLPDPATFKGEYGDAITVGTSYPYTYYIFTRPNTTLGEVENRWLDIGTFPLPGPEGPQGPKGDIGPTGDSTEWHYSLSLVEPPASLGKYHDYFLTYLGEVWYKVGDTEWVDTGISLRGVEGPRGPQGPTGLTGPMGPQGPEGPKGETGSVATIVATLSSVDDLPEAGTIDHTWAYLVGTQSPYTIYVQVGLDNVVWQPVGLFSLEGSYVSKVNSTGTVVYRASNSHPLIAATEEATDSTLALRDQHGCVKGSNEYYDSEDSDLLVNKGTFESYKSQELIMRQILQGQVNALAGNISKVGYKIWDDTWEEPDDSTDYQIPNVVKECIIVSFSVPMTSSGSLVVRLKDYMGSTIGNAVRFTLSNGNNYGYVMYSALGEDTWYVLQTASVGTSTGALTAARTYNPPTITKSTPPQFVNIDCESGDLPAGTNITIWCGVPSNYIGG